MSHRTSLTRKSLWSRLVALAESRPESRQIARLAEMSDSELADRGLTRRGELLRILGPRALI